MADATSGLRPCPWCLAWRVVLEKGYALAASGRSQGPHADADWFGRTGPPPHPQIDLRTHIQDIVAILEYEDVRHTVLVGHSYGGLVIAGVVEQVSERLDHLIYLDAFLPEDGKSLQDYAPVPPLRDDGWRIPSPGSPTDYGVTDERDVAWMTPRLGDQPLKTFTQPVHYATEKTRSLRQTFIQCTKAPFFTEVGERARRQGFRYLELFSAGHDAMVTQPQALAKLFIDGV